MRPRYVPCSGVATRHARDADTPFLCWQALQAVLPATVSITVHNDIYVPPGVAFSEQCFAGVEEFTFADESDVVYEDEWFTLKTVRKLSVTEPSILVACLHF